MEINQKNNPGKDPDFIGIGNQKAATSWIFQCLQDHPEICGSSSKEIHFFDKDYNYNKGLNYYRSFFSHCNKNIVKGEFTPRYIFIPRVAERIYKNYPNIKLVVCLRNPVERTISQYRYALQQKGRLSTYKNFREAFKKDQELIERGFYYKHLSRFLKFFSKENIMILIYRELKNNPLENIQSIYSFLGVDPEFVSGNLYKKKNVTGEKVVKNNIPIINNIFYRGRRIIKSDSCLDKAIDKIGVKQKINQIVKRNKKEVSTEEQIKLPQISQEDKFYLRGIYKEDISNLEWLLNRDLSFWKK